MSDQIRHLSDRWLRDEGPHTDTVLSSRCRLARNLEGHRFSRHASAEERAQILETIAQGIASSDSLGGFLRVDIDTLTAAERGMLRESHLISTEMEREARQATVFISNNAQVSLMINEEDHLRMQAIETGYRIEETFRAIVEVDDALSDQLRFAFSPTLGHLTACPTNTGTGLRVSTLLHLPGLVMHGKIDPLVKEIANHGFAVRGFYGEGSTTAGDLYQISNETTLGKSEEEILESLRQVVDELVEREREARTAVFSERAVYIEDSIWRSFATLSQARMINSHEAICLLSRLRLGIERGLFNSRLSHQRFNRLLIEIQPAHLIHRSTDKLDEEGRDIARADYLRAEMTEILN